MRIDLYGREIEVVRDSCGWSVFYSGSDGKRRPARDIVIPDWVGEDGVAAYLDDLLHEYATQDHPAVRVLEYPEPES